MRTLIGPAKRRVEKVGIVDGRDLALPDVEIDDVLTGLGVDFDGGLSFVLDQQAVDVVAAGAHQQSSVVGHSQRETCTITRSAAWPNYVTRQRALARAFNLGVLVEVGIDGNTALLQQDA